MKFEGSGSKSTRVIERKRSVTDGQTDGRTDGQGKNNMSPPEGGRHNYSSQTSIVEVLLPKPNKKTFFLINPCVFKLTKCTHINIRGPTLTFIKKYQYHEKKN